MPTLRILHVVPTYLPATRYGGPIYSVHGLCRALARAGHDVHVFTTNVDGDGNSDVPLEKPVELDGVKIWYFRSPILRRLFFAPTMARALKTQVSGFDIVHLHSVFLWPTLAAARAARRAGVPYILAPRGMLSRQLIAAKSSLVKRAWIRLFERNNIKHAAMLHATSETESREIERLGIALPNTICVPNGIDFSDVEAASGQEPLPEDGGEFTLFLGRVNWKKGLDRLLELWQYIPNANLLIAGNDEENYRSVLERLIRQYKLADRVQFAGPVTGRDKWQLLRSATLFILPSYSENFGMAVLEAMAVGCPVAVTPEVGLATTVSRTGCGIVIEGSAESMAASINALLQDKSMRARMGARGIETARKEFSWGAIAERMREAYFDVSTRRLASRLAHS